jgi:hypothetical protein
MMNKNIIGKSAAISLIALSISSSASLAGDQAKAIINGIDPKSMNELLEVSRTQRDAALTNIAPLSANKYRFLFVWPASNPVMTYDRVGRSFAERFIVFADQLKPLATGFCLQSKNVNFGTALYGEEEINVAYRDIEVRYQVSWQQPCSGRYIAASDLEQLKPERQSTGYGAGLAQEPLPRPGGQAAPDPLKQFLKEATPPPSQ